MPRTVHIGTARRWRAGAAGLALWRAALCKPPHACETHCTLIKVCVCSPPHSSYALSAVPDPTQNYGTDPSGTIGKHHPKEVIRIERDWSDGEVCQFHPNYPMELEGRVRSIGFHCLSFIADRQVQISPAEFSTLIQEVNRHLIHAYSQKAAVAENILAILTWHTSLFWWTSRFEKVSGC